MVRCSKKPTSEFFFSQQDLMRTVVVNLPIFGLGKATLAGRSGVAPIIPPIRPRVKLPTLAALSTDLRVRFDLPVPR
jgi:hypothetical protein